MANAHLSVILRCFNTLIGSNFVKNCCGVEFIQSLIKAKSNLINTL